MSILNEAREKFGFEKVWTCNKGILYKDNNDGKNLLQTEFISRGWWLPLKWGRK